VAVTHEALRRPESRSQRRHGLVGAECHDAGGGEQLAQRRVVVAREGHQLEALREGGRLCGEGRGEHARRHRVVCGAAGQHRRAEQQRRREREQRRCRDPATQDDGGGIEAAGESSLAERAELTLDQCLERRRRELCERQREALANRRSAEAGRLRQLAFEAASFVRVSRAKALEHPAERLHPFVEWLPPQCPAATA
jgi:hypothetical protein